MAGWSTLRAVVLRGRGQRCAVRGPAGPTMRTDREEMRRACTAMACAIQSAGTYGARRIRPARPELRCSRRLRSSASQHIARTTPICRAELPYRIVRRSDRDRRILYDSYNHCIEVRAVANLNWALRQLDLIGVNAFLPVLTSTPQAHPIPSHPPSASQRLHDKRHIRPARLRAEGVRLHRRAHLVRERRARVREAERPHERAQRRLELHDRCTTAVSKCTCKGKCKVRTRECESTHRGGSRRTGAGPR